MPKTTAEIARQLAKASTDCSFLLTHLVRQNVGKSDRNARDALKSILGLNSNRKVNLVLRATPQGWYSVSQTQDVYTFEPEIDDLASGFKNVNAVCFTESTLAGLRAHRDVFCCKYGVSFDRDWLFQKGANPCLNVREDMFKANVTWANDRYQRKVYNFIPEALFPYINVITESFDATHEREWRHKGDLTFSTSDVLFVFCPESEFHIFSRIQSNGKPTVFDLSWLDRV
jgi:hypothetical protein